MSFFLFIFARMNKKRIIKWAKIVAIIYISGGVALYFLQDAILFHPVTLNRTYSYNFPEPHKDINIPIDSKDTLNLVDFASTDTIARGIVLYFHGNKRNISWYAKYIPYFTRHGYQVLMIDYPGFGKSTGKLTEQKLYDWALQVYKIARKRFPADSIIIYGKSMGTGIAAQLASTRDCKRLILETPYYDFPAVVSHYLPIYPAKWMLHYQLPTYQYLQNVTAPITIFHGTKDRVVTYKNSKRLLPFLKSTDELISIEGGSHNNLYRYNETVNKLDSVLRL
ncbi:MAG: alpha/beta fold hydrolase [Chitinophagaceae bacterium]|nr:alpha/beta fold hydrolase [Chitinophagaceae bacterium]MBL0304731.1 alpha/beta fold hydrolase [Chitinophagaceae bacterium]HQV60084.1 alpha/beta fold hydrolase [Chitinophagaceae bacterium]HQV85473.1 alpha/beta fold hydrolase [Chitinophagaceae bacterium]HQX71800.1 alpha/beta fold hydrolase [Chitinophagaceae bacterium]